MGKCFVIMPFGSPFDQYYNEILRPALSHIGFNVIRADEVYGNRPIIEDIIDQILSSDLIVADVSGKNPNVNYELGMAHTLGRQVIIVTQQIKDVPFDYRHIRTIIYNPTKKSWKVSLKQALQRTAKTILESGYEKFSFKSLDNFYQRYSASNLLGLQRVFRSRQNMNVFLDDLWKNPIAHLDIIAFGLKSFRDFRSTAVNKYIKEGMKIRILTIDPYSTFLGQREADEKLVTNSIRKTILDLIVWSRRINKLNPGCPIQIKFYDSLPLDFYWRQDENLFIGPYLQGMDSQQTVTFHFQVNSDVGAFYSNYFDRLWGDKTFTKSKISEHPAV